MKSTAHSKQVYESWVAQFSGDLYRMAYRLVGSAHAEDLTQETFYHAWRSMGTLKDPAKARAWLFQILRFRYAHWVRSRIRQPRPAPLAEMTDQHLPADPGRSTLDSLIDRERIQQAMEELDDLFKIPFLMVFLEGLTCKETALELDLPLGTVLSRIHRARQMMRSKLARVDAAEATGRDGDQTHGDRMTGKDNANEGPTPQGSSLRIGVRVTHSDQPGSPSKPVEQVGRAANPHDSSGPIGRLRLRG